MAGRRKAAGPVTPLGRYTGPLILREVKRKPASSGNYPRKRYPQHRDIYGKLLSDHKVTIEAELAEIRARHELLREYNRARYARQLHQKAMNHGTADHRELDESDSQ